MAADTASFVNAANLAPAAAKPIPAIVVFKFLAELFALSKPDPSNIDLILTNMVSSLFAMGLCSPFVEFFV